MSSQAAIQLTADPGLGAGSVVGDRYEIRCRLGSGAIGDVYLAVDRHLGHREVAIKVLSQAVEAGPHAREISSRFLLEAQALAAVRDDHVVSILNYGVMRNGTPYLVMEYLDGESLESLLKSVDGRGLPLGRAVDIAVDVCGGVHICHTKDVVHRDLKPANIFLERTPRGERAKIVDFGIAKTRASAKFSSSGVMMGTPAYMAPEQLARGVSDARSDQYAIGVVLFRCLTGDLPKGGLDPRRSRPETPDDLAEVVMRALSHDPTARHPSVHALGRALMRFASAEVAARWRCYYNAPDILSSAALTKTLVLSSARALPDGTTTRSMAQPVPATSDGSGRVEAATTVRFRERSIRRTGIAFALVAGFASATVMDSRDAPLPRAACITRLAEPAVPVPVLFDTSTNSQGAGTEAMSRELSAETTSPSSRSSSKRPSRRLHVLPRRPIRVRYSKERDPILE